MERVRAGLGGVGTGDRDASFGSGEALRPASARFCNVQRHALSAGIVTMCAAPFGVCDSASTILKSWQRLEVPEQFSCR